MKIVLDAWPVLAMIFKEEPAAKQVARLFDDGAALPEIHMSWINTGEVYYRIAARKGRVSADSALSDLGLLPIKFHEPSKKDIIQAAGYKSMHRLSYADAFAVALAERLDAVIWTGDPEIVALGEIVKVHRLSRK